MEKIIIKTSRIQKPYIMEIIRLLLKSKETISFSIDEKDEDLNITITSEIETKGAKELQKKFDSVKKKVDDKFKQILADISKPFRK